MKQELSWSPDGPVWTSFINSVLVRSFYNIIIGWKSVMRDEENALLVLDVLMLFYIRAGKNLDFFRKKLFSGF